MDGANEILSGVGAMSVLLVAYVLGQIRETGGGEEE